MLTRRPVVYNFFDVDVYKKTRGFSYDPIELMCVGPIVKTKRELEEAIESQLNSNENKYQEKYEWVRRLTHAYDDGNASERIYFFIMQIMNKDVR
jgi:CDP-glycerol glycerophosphotransferase (TagB/SpsB family)